MSVTVVWWWVSPFLISWEKSHCLWEWLWPSLPPLFLPFVFSFGFSVLTKPRAEDGYCRVAQSYTAPNRRRPASWWQRPSASKHQTTVERQSSSGPGAFPEEFSWDVLSSDKGKARRPRLARKPEGLKADKGLIFSSLLNFEVAGASRAQCRHIQDGFFLSVQ